MGITRGHRRMFCGFRHIPSTKSSKPSRNMTAAAPWKKPPAKSHRATAHATSSAGINAGRNTSTADVEKSVSSSATMSGLTLAPIPHALTLSMSEISDQRATSAWARVQKV
jgi:hypothetical protein